MKKLSLIALAGGVLAFASCAPEETNTEGMFTQGQVDSMVDARVEELHMEMLRQNDSIINVRAMELADSIMAAKKGNPGKVTNTVKNNTGGKTGSSAGKPSTVGSGKPSMKNDDGSVGSGKPSMKDENKNEVGTGKPSMR